MTEHTWLKYLKQLSWQQTQQKQQLNRHFAFFCNKMKLLVTGYIISLKQNHHSRNKLALQGTDSSDKIFTQAADISIRILGIAFNSDLSILMIEELCIFVFFLWMEDSSLGKEDKCCEQLCELTPAWGAKQAGKPVILIALHSDQGVQGQIFNLIIKNLPQF